MSSGDILGSRSPATKKIAPDPLPLANPGSSAPTTFFLKTEREMEASVQRGRKTSRTAVLSSDVTKDTLENERQFGVESLEETLSALEPPEDDASRTASNSTDRSSEAATEGAGVNIPLKRKRKTGNRVHPSIRSAGERIISSERVPTQTSPKTKVPDSPFRSPHLRRNSAASPIVMTPMRMSPPLVSATPSTPRSGSPRSFQLSDMESNHEETSSQAVQSSNGDDDLERTPQLVMPSLTMPTRRAFTEKGKHIGRANFMVIGHGRGVGRTSFINSFLRSSQHVVHFDHNTDLPSFNTDVSDLLSTSGVTDRLEQPASCHYSEFLASTRMLPAWRIQQSGRRQMSQKRPSVSEGVLDRNLTFIDAASLDDDGAVQAVLDFITASLYRTAHMDSMTDNEVVSLLSGDGGHHITAIIYLFDPTLAESPLAGLSPAHQDLLRRVSKHTNFIPLIGKADTVSVDTLQLRKEQVSQLLEDVQATPYRLMELRLTGSTEMREPLAISSLPGEDETMDASILMSSQYLAPLVPSELGQLVDLLLEPENLARMRYEGSWKLLAWRQENVPLEQQRSNHLLSPHLGYQTTDAASDGSFADHSSKALVMRAASSFGRSESPAVPDNLTPLGAATGTSALARYNEQSQPTEPFRQVRLAKWAKDLQNSLQNQSRRYQKIYQTPIVDWTINDDENENALVATKGAHRPPRGHLGGEVGVIDPRDPLGMLAIAQSFSRRGFFLVQLVGGCGLVGAVFYCVAKSWPDVAEFFGLTSPPVGMTAAVPPPTSRDHGQLMRWLADVRLLI